MKQVDLHIHTTFSDGKLTPCEVIKEAYHRDIAAVAITDHDTMGGVDQAIKAGQKYGVEVVPGIELSTYFRDKEIHILGFYCEAKHKLLEKTLSFIRQARYYRIRKMLDLLKKIGINLEMKEVMAIAGGESLGRPHLAELIFQKGYCHSPREAFQLYLGEGKPAYVKRLKMSAEIAFKLVRRSGGLAILAHPGIYRIDKFIPELKCLGLSGLEVFHPDHNLATCLRYYRLAQKYGLIISGGSDFHGPDFGAAAAPGAVTVSYNFLERIKARKENVKIV